jgi:hypothetical protein
MSGLLYIGNHPRKGLEWEQNIWFTHGADPFGAEGWPESGLPTFVWTRITNASNRPASDIRVRFYYSPAGTSLLRDRAIKLGESFVSLTAGASRSVPCFSKWIPNLGAQGGCVVVEAVHCIDPIPKSNVFEFYLSQIGIINIAVLSPKNASADGFVVHELMVPWLSDLPVSRIHVSDDSGKSLLDKALTARFGLDKLRSTDMVEYGLAKSPDVAGSWRGCVDLDIDSIAVGGAERVYVIAVFQKPVQPDGYQVLRVSDTRASRVVGGFSLIFKG